METESPKAGVVSRIFGWLWSILTRLFSSVFSRFTKNRRFKLEEATCYAAHPSFYLWALIVFGWSIAPFLNNFPGYRATLTWTYIWVLFYSFVLLAFDLGTIKVIVCTGVYLLVLMTCKYIEAVQHLALLGGIVNHFRDLDAEMSGGVASAISWLLFIPWIVTLVETYRSGQKSFSPNGIEERHILQGRDILDRSGMHFKCHYPDLLEAILGFGSGTITAYDKDNDVVKEWSHLIGLYFKWNRLDEILHQRSAVVDNAPNDPVEVEEVVRTVEKDK